MPEKGKKIARSLNYLHNDSIYIPCRHKIYDNRCTLHYIYCFTGSNSLLSVMIKSNPLFDNINKPRFTDSKEYSNKIALVEHAYQVPERKKKDIGE